MQSDKNPQPNSGIYKIVNIVNRKTYVGSSRNLKARKLQHFCALRKGDHPNSHLQRAFNKQEESSFIFEIIEFCEASAATLIEREKHHILAMRSCDKSFGYNIRSDPSSNSGIVPSDETRKKISQAHKGKKLSEETKAKMRGRIVSEETRQKLREARVGYVPPRESVLRGAEKRRGKKHSDEHNKKIGAAQIGKKVTDETRRKISDAKKGAIFSEEHIAKLRTSHLGKHLSEQAKEKLRKIHVSEEARLKRSVALKGKHHTEETKTKIRLSRTGMRPTSKTKKKMSDSAKKRWVKNEKTSIERCEKMRRARKAKANEALPQ
jgi:group I intron endonuclease